MTRRAATAVAASLALVGGMLGAVPVARADAGPLGRPAVPAAHSAKVHDVGLGAAEARQQVARSSAAEQEQAARAASEQHASWPGGGTATVGAGGTAVTVGGLPVRLTAPASTTASPADVTVLDQQAAHAAGVEGVLLLVAPKGTAAAQDPAAQDPGAQDPGAQDSAAWDSGVAGPETQGSGLASRQPAPVGGRLSVGYAAFASAYGGDWSGRLSLVRLPACALTTPEKAACRATTPLRTANDVAGRTLSADLPAATSPLLVAISAGQGESAKGSGDYTAAQLSSSSTWAQGGASGSFTWSYPMTTPPAPAGPAPTLGLAYDSGSVDGRTASTNNQTSQVGEGFATMSDSYVTRQFGSCDQDGHDKVYDSCWKFDNASLVLNGTATELVKDAAGGTWRLADDDASTVVHSTGADNGDQGDGVDGAGEYWTVITGDGTKYVFGLNKLPGAGTQRTNSVWTVPVFGDDSGEPGYAKGDAFADRWYDQAWRWNLDYVVDTHGNAETYWYTAETNSYKKNGATTADATYTRGGYLDHILYGQRSGTLFTATAPYQVHFGYQERCVTGDCSSLTSATAPNWPDVPFDAICAARASDTACKAEAPSFFTRKRLTQVRTSVWPGTGTSYTPVDTWDLKQKYLDPGDIGDSSDQSLALDSITHTGNSAGDTAMDPVSFTYRMLPNRVDAADDILPLNRPRIDTVESETGAITTVTMSPQDDCVRGSKMPAAEDDDTMACFPQYWHVNGAADASIDWFHKYRVLTVLESDPAGGNLAVQTSYDYSDPAWHYDDSPFTPDDERTWSSWRGYGTVTTITGTDPSNRLRTVTRYLQGMNGDRQKSGTPRAVSVPGLPVPGLNLAAVTDSDEFAGFQREQVTYDGSTAISATADDPWSSRTAIQHTGSGDLKAFYVRPRTSYDYTYLTVPGRWRTRSTTTTYDSYGMAVTEDDAGDTGKTGDEICTRTWYARNAAAGLTSLVSRVRKVARPCGTADGALSLPANSATRGDVLSDIATVYDDVDATVWTAAQTPTAGDAYWTGRAAGYPATPDANGDRNPAGWQTTGTSTFDALGRTLSTTDAAGNTDSTEFTPAGAGPLTKTVDGNALAQKATTFYDGLRGLRTTVYDVDGKKTELTYDGLGRLLGVWLPNRSKSNGDTASTTYAYQVKRGAAPFVATSVLGPNGTRVTSYQIYDSLLRPIQVQAPTPVGGRTLTDTRYDSRGLAYDTFAGIFDDATTPNGVYARAEDNGAPTEHRFVFDGAGRQTSDALWIFGVRKGNPTLTGYTGDSTAVSPPAGGSASRTVTDARGRTVELREYAGTSPADTDFGGAAPAPAHTTTAYAYTGDDQKARVTGPDGATWSYGYDLFGRQTSATDPDKGDSTAAYTVLDQIDSTTDAAGHKLLYSYDAIGRTTGEWQTARTDAGKLSAWTYDTVAKGQAAAAISYDGGVNGRAYTQKVTEYDDLYHATQTETDLDPADPLVTSGAVKPSYTFSSSYYPDGSLQSSTEPAAGGLPLEHVGYGYGPTGKVNSVTGATGYLQHVAYSPLAEPQQLTLATAPSGVKKAFLTDTYEQGTGRLTTSKVTDETHAYAPQDLAYSYDDAGNVTRIGDSSTQGGTGKADTQCFGYDGYRRLTSAWTPADATCGTAAGSAVGGAAPYSTGYSYDVAGLRTALTTHAATGDTTASYCHTDAARKHALTAVTTGTCAGSAASYGYDAIGDTVKRPGRSGGQSLTWNAQGNLSKTTEGTATTDYVYDGGGNLLIRRASTGGESVLYLGSTEIHTRTAGGTTTTWGVRSYTEGPSGPVIAIRSTAGSGTPALSWLAGDDHGTSSLAMDATTQAVVKRYTDPFGGDRGTPPAAWPDDKSFLGAPDDARTGLIQIGDRQYDPAVGGFISVDPLLETDKPQTLNGYSYGADNPVTYSDPSGDGLLCGVRDEPACPHTPSKGRGDQGDHRTPKEKDQDNSKSSPSHGNSGGKTLDPKTREWLRKNLGYNGGANLDDAAFRAWIENVDLKKQTAVVAFDACLQTGSAAAQCEKEAEQVMDGGGGKSTQELVYHQLAVWGSASSTGMIAACAFVTADTLGAAGGPCGTAAMAWYTAVGLPSTAYLTYETCQSSWSSSDCLTGMLALTGNSAAFAKSEQARIIARQSQAAYRTASRWGQTAWNATSGAVRSAGNTARNAGGAVRNTATSVWHHIGF
ncbi:RHS repeat-associated core domain-containing protein [Microbispora corallina]|uniref:Teneurin-like YD-shell domain-containing protein n=1 Tax=Microbispora corallina TaxID=83302 RepID=A0ABQ4GA71_9ACTN|nr:RHS repeat-associated core domain-containing protein [Microbispora corallina]GIH43926.1 hypothetical protein Mco01_69260 [Microbispora corallina]